MRVEILQRHIEAMDFAPFRELARKATEERGFGEPVGSDGWNDGGRDIRVYSGGGAEPLRFAIQVSVEKKWEAKLEEDLVKAKDRLHCHAFLYVSSRRIADAPFQKVVDRARKTHGVSVSKMDAQDLAQLVLDRKLLGWLLSLLGLEVPQTACEAISLTEEVIHAFVLFSDDVSNFRDRMADRALLVVSAREGPMPREALLKKACEALGLGVSTHGPLLKASLDRLLQAKNLSGAAGIVAAPPEVVSEHAEMRRLGALAWKAFRDSVEQALRKHLPRAANAVEIADRVAGDMGRILLAYRDYQAALLQQRTITDPVRRKYAREIQQVHANLLALGVSEADLRACVSDLRQVAEQHQVVSQLTAGEVFRKVISGDRATFLGALGDARSITIYFDTSVMIPLLCARLYGVVDERYVLGGIYLHDFAAGMGTSIALPDVYLEECAAHLVVAGNYEPIVDSGAEDLTYSENAFVSYYSRLSAPKPKFRKFLSTFGYRDPGMDFFRHRDEAIVSLGRLAERYGVTVPEIRRWRGRRVSLRSVEEALSHIYRSESINRPTGLVQHDAKVVQYLREQTVTAGSAQMLATWDHTLHLLAADPDARWWCLDPVAAADLVSLVRTRGEQSALGVEMALLLGDAEKKAAAQLWDALIQIEQGDLRDADLLEQAKSFRVEFLSRQGKKRVQFDKVREAWAKWKEKDHAGRE